MACVSGVNITISSIRFKNSGLTCCFNKPRTSTLALNAATLPFVLKLAQNGYRDALSSDANFLAGLNVCQGNVTYKAVADDLDYEFVDPSKAIN